MLIKAYYINNEDAEKRLKTGQFGTLLRVFSYSRYGFL
jgi:hypothetical protein